MSDKGSFGDKNKDVRKGENVLRRVRRWRQEACGGDEMHEMRTEGSKEIY